MCFPLSYWSGATQKSSNEEPIYETLPNGTTKTGFGASMPTRNPPPPAVPIKTHPSLNKKKKKKVDINRPSTSYDEDDDDSFTSVTEDELEDLDNTTNFERKSNYPTVARMTRGGLWVFYQYKGVFHKQPKLNSTLRWS